MATTRDIVYGLAGLASIFGTPKEQRDYALEREKLAAQEANRKALLEEQRLQHEMQYGPVSMGEVENALQMFGLGLPPILTPSGTTVQRAIPQPQTAEGALGGGEVGLEPALGPTAGETGTGATPPRVVEVPQFIRDIAAEEKRRQTKIPRTLAAGIPGIVESMIRSQQGTNPRIVQTATGAYMWDPQRQTFIPAPGVPMGGARQVNPNQYRGLLKIAGWDESREPTAAEYAEANRLQTALTEERFRPPVGVENAFFDAWTKYNQSPTEENLKRLKAAKDAANEWLGLVGKRSEVAASGRTVGEYSGTGAQARLAFARANQIATLQGRYDDNVPLSPQENILFGLPQGSTMGDARAAGLIPSRPPSNEMAQIIGQYRRVWHDMKIIKQLYRPEFVGKGFMNFLGTARAEFAKAHDEMMKSGDGRVYGQYDGRLFGALSGALMAGLGTASPQEITFRQSVRDAANAYLYATSGKQINEAEYHRLLDSLFRLTDEPQTFVTNVDTAHRRTGELLKNMFEAGALPLRQQGSEFNAEFEREFGLGGRSATPTAGGPPPPVKQAIEPSPEAKKARTRTAMQTLFADRLREINPSKRYTDADFARLWNQLTPEEKKRVATAASGGS